MVKPKKLDLRKVYTELSLTRKLREAHGMERRAIHDMAEMLKDAKMGDEKPVRILLQGEIPKN